MSSSLPQEIDISEAYLITKRFQTPEEFSEYIAEEAQRQGMNCMDVLLEYCEVHDVDPIAVAALLTEDIKQYIQVEAEELNLLVKE
jgi:hypothetical protein